MAKIKHTPPPLQNNNNTWVKTYWYCFIFYLFLFIYFSYIFTVSIRSLEEENRNLKDQQICKICLDEPVAIVFLPCSHMAACVNCAPALRSCPICRAYIKGTVKAIICWTIHLNNFGVSWSRKTAWLCV